MVNKQLQYTYRPISQEVKDNQVMKFGQLIEYNTRKVLLKNHRRNVVEKLFPDPFPKSQN